MEIYQLRYFAAVAESGNFTKAAARCFVSQPSLSQQILNLEAELGQKLFHRLGRRISLTPAGHLLLEKSRRILLEVDNTLKELKDDPSSAHRVAVGCIPTLAPYQLPRVVACCRRLYPRLEITAQENFYPQLVELVVQGELDLALVARPIKDPRVVVEPLMQEPLLLALGRQHPLVVREKITLRDLRDETFIMLGDASSLAAQIQRFFGDHDFDMRIGFRCAQVATVKALVAEGAGISILPAGTTTPEDAPALVYKVLAGRPPVREIAYIRHPRRYQSRGVAQFIAALKECFIPPPPVTPVSAPPFPSEG
jgi:LysR family hydrogen peroxide-inducible transcriptional activator